jgi:hypothetical protein
MKNLLRQIDINDIENLSDKFEDQDDVKFDHKSKKKMKSYQETNDKPVYRQPRSKPELG